MPKRISSWVLRFLFSSTTRRWFRARSIDISSSSSTERLGDQIEGAGANGFDGGFHGAVAGHQNDGRVGPMLAAMGQHVEAVAVAQAHIDQRQVVVLLAQRRDRLGDAGHGVDGKAQLAQPGRPWTAAGDDRRPPATKTLASWGMPRAGADVRPKTKRGSLAQRPRSIALVYLLRLRSGRQPRTERMSSELTLGESRRRGRIQSFKSAHLAPRRQGHRW